MKQEIILMPETDGSGDVIEFCIEVGDSIAAGDSILVLESDKASMEVPAQFGGVLEEWLVDIGQSAETGTPLARVRLEEPSNLSSEERNEDSDSENTSSEPVAEVSAFNVEPVSSEQSADTKVLRTVHMPEIEGSGDVIEYCVEIGDSVAEGDSLLVLESDKASMEVPATAAGIVKKWLIEIGQSAESGTPLAIIAAQVDNSEENIEADPEKADHVPVSGIISSIDNQSDIAPAISNAPAVSPKKRVYAGPATRKLARELGVSLDQIQGSGTRGRVLKDDIKHFVKQRMTAAPASSQPARVSAEVAVIPAIPAQDFSQFGDIKEESLSGIARATSSHMTRCWLNIPHVTLFDEVNISELESYRKQIDPTSINLEKRPSLLPFIVMVVARALRRFPQFNCSISADGNSLVYKDYVNIGIAVDTPAGLVVPVIKDADTKGIAQLTRDINEFALKAKQRKLRAEDMQGGCFTVSSLGAMGGTGFTPIINAPEVAILGVARSEIKPVWDVGSETFLPATKLPLCLSFDHRVINGADAGRFMAWVHQCLAEIRQLIL